MSPPIGIFDSGIGGVSILSEIRQLLPQENILYVADSAYCPYGTKSVELIRERTLRITAFLVSQKTKAVVVACNTACSAGLDEVRIENPEFPIIGLEPAVKPAHNITRCGKIGVLCTEVTSKGERFSGLADKFGGGIEIFTQPAPGLADLVDSGQKDSPETQRLLNKYLKPLIAEGIDTLVLGCTHYPFLKERIQEICGPSVKLLDTGAAVAKQTKRVLQYDGLLADTKETSKGKVIFHTTGDGAKVKQVLETLWSEPVDAVKEIKL